MQLPLPYKILGIANALYTFIFENFWTKFGLKMWFRIPSILENVAGFC